MQFWCFIKWWKIKQINTLDSEWGKKKILLGFKKKKQHNMEKRHLSFLRSSPKEIWVCAILPADKIIFPISSLPPLPEVITFWDRKLSCSLNSSSIIPLKMNHVGKEQLFNLFNYLYLSWQCLGEQSLKHSRSARVES